MVEGRILARLRGLVREGRRRRRVRAQDERRHGRRAAQGQGQLQEPRVRRSRRAARVPQRSGRVRQGRLAVSRLLLEGRRRGGRRARVGGDARHAAGHGRQRSGRAAVFARTVSGSTSGRRRRQPPPAPDGAPAPRVVDMWHWQDPLLQPMQRVRAQQERNRNYRAVVHLADKRFVQLATPDFPNVAQGDDPARAIGTSELAYRSEMSWDTTYNDVALVDLKTGQRQPILTHWRGTPTMSPGGRYLLYFDENEADWFTYRISDGAKVNLTSKLGLNFWREDHDSPSLPPAYGSAGWTAKDASVLLYDKYDIWEIKPDGTGAAHADRRRRAQEADRLPLPLARSRRARDSDRQADAALGQRRQDREQRLLSRRLWRHRRAREDRDGRQVVRSGHQGAQRRSRRLHAGAVRRVPGSLGQRHELPRHEEGLERQPAAERVRLGQGRADAVHQRGRQDAARHHRQARQLRPVEEVPADGLHLRGAVGGPAQLPRAESGHEHQHHALRQQRLRRADARHRLRNGLSRARAPRSASSRPSIRSSRRATSIRSGSASRATRGAATRSRTSSPAPTCSRPCRPARRCRT